MQKICYTVVNIKKLGAAMDNSVHNYRKWAIMNVIFLVCLIAGFAGAYLYTGYLNGHELTCTDQTENGRLTVRAEVEKSWSEHGNGYGYGIQYKVTMKNETRIALHDWTLTLELPEGCRIDSSWNGAFVLAGDTLTVTPMDYNMVIEPKHERDIGFVLWTNETDNILSYKLQVYRMMRLRDLNVFWLLVILVGIYVVSTVTSMFFLVRTRRLALQRQQYLDIVNESFLTFAGMIDAKDPYTQGHSQRVAIYAREMAKRMGLSKEEQQNIFYVALLHDIGKIGVPDAVLKKAGRLDVDERQMIEQHVQMGGDILKNFSAIKDIEAGARFHHEKYDGTGYVSNLVGKQIPLVARIICVADAFDAMTSMRCYRPRLPMEKVISELKECSGTQFDPDLVPYMLQMIDEGVVPVELSKEELYRVLVQNNC